MTSTLDSNKKLVHTYLEDCWNEGKLEMVPQFLSAHCRFHDPAFPHLVAGIDSMQHHIKRAREGFPDLKFTVTDTIAEGSEVVVHWNLSGTQKGEFLGMPETNVNAVISGTSIYRIKDGKIEEHWADWNLMSLIEKLGLRAAAGVPAGLRTHVGWE